MFITNRDKIMLIAIKIPITRKNFSEKLRERFGLNLGGVGPPLDDFRLLLFFAI